MNNFLILNEERRTIPKWSCPVDLMGEIKKTAKEPVAFKLTATALIAMLSFPVKKSVEFMPDDESETVIHATVIWLPSMETMTLWTNNGGETFMVESADTEELPEYQLEGGKFYTCYTIDVE